MAELRGLTIWQPWADAIAYGTKRVENRPWLAPPWMKDGGLLAIHAGQATAWDARPPGGEGWADPPMGLPRMSHGVILAVATLEGCHWPLSPVRAFTRAGHPCAPGAQCSPWGAADEVHWELAGVVALSEPVPCRGKQRLWRLPEDVEKAVRKQLEADHG
jgi:hypothetical protein